MATQVARIPGTVLRDLRAQMTVRRGEDRIQHLMRQDYEVKVSAGTWFAAPGGGRFHDRYVAAQRMPQILEVYGNIPGLKGISAHFDGEFTRSDLPMFDAHQARTGQALRGIALSHFFAPAFEYGALDNPLAQVRNMALDIAVAALRIAKERQEGSGDEVLVISWPGISGFTQPFGFDFHQALDNYEAGLAQAMDIVPGVRVAIEGKPAEPTPHNIVRTTGDTLITCANIEKRLTNPVNLALLNAGHALVGKNPELGHKIMGQEVWAQVLANICRQGRLFLTHWNDQDYNVPFDADLNVGILRPKDVFDGLFVLREFAPTVWCELDMNPERQNTNNAILRSMQILRLAAASLNTLLGQRKWAELIVKGYEDPHRYRANLDHFATLLSMGETNAFTMVDDTAGRNVILPSSEDPISQVK